MSKLRLAGSATALVVAALVGGTLISVAAAAPAKPTTPAPEALPPAEPSAGTTAERAEPGPYCEAFRAAFATNLGVSEAEVVAAAKAAIGTAVDQAVTDGAMTQAAADRVKSRVAATDGEGCGILSGWRGKVAQKALAVARDGLTAAADTLGMTLAELRDQLRAGASLKDVAAAKAVPYETVTAAVTTAVKADVDAAVAAGTIGQARADRILDRLERRLEAGWPRKPR